MSKNEIVKKVNAVNGLINEAKRNGDYHKRQELEEDKMHLTDAIYFNMIMPKLQQLNQARLG